MACYILGVHIHVKLFNVILFFNLILLFFIWALQSVQSHMCMASQTQKPCAFSNHCNLLHQYPLRGFNDGIKLWW